MDGVLSRVPGLAGFLAQGEIDQRKQSAQLAQMGVLSELSNRMRLQQQQEQERAMLSQSGGNLEQAVQGLLKSGNAAGAARLAPLLEAQRKANAPQPGQPIGAGGLLMPDGRVVGPEMRPAAPTKLEQYIAVRDRLKAQGLDTTAYDNAIRKESEIPRQIVPQVVMPRQEPAPIVKDDGKGNLTFFDRQGNILRKVAGGGAPSAANQKVANSRAQQQRELTQAISELEEATKDGGLIDQSTGSGAGAAVDAAVGFFGKATPGAVASGRMKPIYDLALKMVPRFEGPQSDKDTKSYAQAAGDLGNPNTPNATKKAAGREILRLMKARRGQFTSKEVDSAGGAASFDFSEADALVGQ